VGFIDPECLGQIITREGRLSMNVNAVKPLVRIFIHELAPADEEAVDKIAGILHQKILSMPRLMQTALSFLTHLYNVTGTRLGPFKEMLRFYRKMTFFIYYSPQEPSAPCRN
jgi:hypothetical protein